LERKFRITASKFGSIAKATEKRDMEKLCNSLFHPPVLNSEAIIHGKLTESVAIAKFEEITSLKVSKIGLCIHPSLHFLAGSPDGLIKSTGELLEVKCPFNGRDEKIKPGKHFPFLMKACNGDTCLKRNHDYYYQIQVCPSQIFLKLFTLVYVLPVATRFLKVFSCVHKVAFVSA
jgi:hypothetical protein